MSSFEGGQFPTRGWVDRRHQRSEQPASPPTHAVPDLRATASPRTQNNHVDTSNAAGLDSGISFLSGFSKERKRENIFLARRQADLPEEFAEAPPISSRDRGGSSSDRWLALYSIPPSSAMTVVSYLDVRYGEVEAYHFELEQSPHDPGHAVGRRGVLYVVLREEFASQRIALQKTLSVPLPRSTATIDGESSMRVQATWVSQPPAKALEELARKRRFRPTTCPRPGNFSVDAVFTQNQKLHQRVIQFLKSRGTAAADRPASFVARLRTGVLTMPQVDAVNSEFEHVIVLPTPWYLRYYYWSTAVLVALLWAFWHYVLN